MITASNIFLKYGDRILFNNVNLVIGNRDKLGLVGRNGAGKSTFLRILSGEQSPDGGKVSRPSGTSLNYLHQDIDIPKGKSVKQEAMTAFEEVKKLEREIKKINEALAERTDYESEAYAQLISRLAEANDQLQFLGGDKTEALTEQVLKGLGFKLSDFDRLIETFSGGWQMRVELAKMLLRKPDYLFLDEPTNHLDIESIIWLEAYLRQYPGCVVVVSHDKQFLDNVIDRTVEIELGNLYDYKANYSRFEVLKKERKEKQEAAFLNQQRVIADKERTINRFMAKATKTKMAQSMQKQLDKLERIELDVSNDAVMNLRFPPAERAGRVVIDAKNLVKSYGEKLVLNEVDLKIDRGEKVAFVGQNGQGKTTLAKLLVNELEATSGEINHGHKVTLGYYAQDQSEKLNGKITLLETMEQEAPEHLRPKVRSILGAFMFSGEDVEKKVSVLSGGERARLALAVMLLHPFNLLVLDEPTNHLDMHSKEVLKHALLDYDGTMIIVSHDRDFLADLSTRTVEFRDKKLHNYIGDVNAFLEKRKLDNMREVEMRTKAQNESNDQNNGASQKVDHQQRKKLQRVVQNAEKEVEKLEEKIADFELKMADPAFYEDPNSQKEIEKYKVLKQQLDEAMEKWEEAQLEWEELFGEG